jgi:hypothetical protein
MANRKKRKKKATKSKRTGGKKLARSKERAKKGTAPKKSARKKPREKATAKGKALGAKLIGGKKVAAGNKRNRRKSHRPDVVTFSRKVSGSRSGEQSGDLQGLSNVEAADSESVQELLEEGNAFEAEVVKGVEDAGDRSGRRELRTHEVPEDDVPGEYLDNE